jgi:hypothetical protein
MTVYETDDGGRRETCSTSSEEVPTSTTCASKSLMPVNILEVWISTQTVTLRSIYQCQCIRMEVCCKIFGPIELEELEKLIDSSRNVEKHIQILLNVAKRIFRIDFGSTT